MTYDISKSSKSSASEKVAKKKAWRGREVGLGGGPASTSSRFAPQSRRLQVSRDGKLTWVANKDFSELELRTFKFQNLNL